VLPLHLSARKTRYFAKDLDKAQRAYKFIGRGSFHSSTRAYAQAVAPLANSGAYIATDVVMISAEGARRGRLEPDYVEIARAISAGAHFITDIPADRDRSYNLGERQVAEFLIQHGYREIYPGYWSSNERTG